jgi:hypothetical protein
MENAVYRTLYNALISYAHCPAWKNMALPIVKKINKDYK